MDHPPLREHSFIERRARVRREDVERGGLDALLDGPLDGALEHAFVVVVHAEDEAAIDHHACIVQASDGCSCSPG